jgi:type VI secretion system protein ImpJ
MSPGLNKVIWTEGMYLAPHHFQAQSRFFESSVRFLTESFWQFSFGFLGLEIDQNELRRGFFQLHHLRGIMPDGLAFEISTPEDLPAGRDVAGLFPETGHPLVLFLAVRSYREGQQNVAADGPPDVNPPLRFRPSVTTLTDFNTGQDLKPVRLLKPNFRIVTDREKDSLDTVLPLARILRDGKGQYVLDQAYIPPSLRAAASPRLQFLLNRLLEILASKSRELSQRRMRGSDPGGFQRELAEFWLLHSVNAAIPVLRLWKTGRSPHPMQIYLGLSQLAGTLCTFNTASDLSEIPAYDHLALGDCFAILDEHIQRHLELGLSANCVTIPLRRFQPLFFGASIDDPRCFGASRWVLALKAEGPETTLISQVPSRVKVSARDWIERVVRQAVPGVPLTWIPAPPSSVAARIGVLYFSVDREHALFDPIRKQGNIGVYVPAGIPAAEIELHVVLETRA